jgi:hypothetical protein
MIMLVGEIRQRSWQQPAAIRDPEMVGAFALSFRIRGGTMKILVLLILGVAMVGTSAGQSVADETTQQPFQST